jgi:hypothetical protein
MRFLGLAIIFLTTFVHSQGQVKSETHDDMQSCPMHAQHQTQTTHDHTLTQRGDKGMGFSQDRTTHHFLIDKNGGTIQVVANRADDKASIAEIRTHLKHIASAFQAGDFEIPMFVHDQTPPGVPVMTRLKNEISYRFEEMDNGGRVVITTRNPEALTAVREFLSFQIEEHKTGDPE